MDADGDNVTNITNSPETDDEYPDWSPTDEEISFIRDGDIWTMNNDGSDPEEVHDAETDVVGRASWKPDKHAFLFSIEGDPYVWLVWEDGTNHQRLVLGREGDWGPTAYRIVFALHDEIQGADMMGGTRGTLTSNDAEDKQPDWNWAEFVLPNTPTRTPEGTPAWTATSTSPATDTPPPPTSTPAPPPFSGDVDCGGTVNSIDAALVLQFVGALIDGLPCQANGDVDQGR